MRYLIIPKDSKPFFTDNYDNINHYVEGMKVFDLGNMIYTENGRKWSDIETDHL